MKPDDYIEAARVPLSLRPQVFGLWMIERVWAEDMQRRNAHLSVFHQALAANSFARVGFPSYTLLWRTSWSTLHLSNHGDLVMEDSRPELRKHLPIWMNAHGSVLITGLGLGCVVRGLLASKKVDHITVVEIDKQILRVVGHEFRSNHRVELIHGDALNFYPGRRKFDFGWHDLWTEGEEHLQVQHARLIKNLHRSCRQQGAWEFPRYLKRRLARHVPILK
jgi:hypothetical protein